MYYGVAYYPEHWPEENWDADAKNIKKCNMDGVRVGEFAWCRLEPEEGVFNFDWLDKAIDVLGRNGLKIVIGTPTATPPSWLVHKHPEILPVDGNGIQMKNGVRKYYCHSNPVYRKYSQRIVEKLAEHYKDNPYVSGWQIDNEFGDHDTVRCYCNSCRKQFITWCQEKYESLNALNQAWGTVFWSQEYSAWEQVDLPYPRRPIGLNPSHLLDYYRFASDQVIDYASLQIKTLRKYICKDQWITTNIIATFWEIDFQKLSRDLDFISWDCYTIIDAMSPVRYPDGSPPPPVMFPPNPALLSLVHDLMRGFKHKPFWVMETAGQDRLVSYHTIAHGGDGINFFRWKGSRFGAEQSRGGYEYNGIFSSRFHEGQQIGMEFHDIAQEIDKTHYKGQVGLLYSFDMGWAYDIQYIYPRSTWINGVGYWRLLEEYYTAFWKENIPVEPVCVDDDWSEYPVIILPCLYLTKPEINEKLIKYVADGGTLITGPASGTKDWNNVYLESLPLDGRLKELFGCELVGGGSFNLLVNELKVTLNHEAPFASEKTFICESKLTDQTGFFGFSRPTEVLRPTSAQIFASFMDGSPAGSINYFEKGKAIYLGFSPGESFLNELIQWLKKDKDICSIMETPDGVEATKRCSENEDYIFLINHSFSDAEVDLKNPYFEIITQEKIEGVIKIPPQHTFILKEQNAGEERSCL